ncbi:phosphoenolpyruvate carboxylase [Neptunicella sp. SCSIO 80796]|uniref:phosphoenolpyruvate carboxylase n=1 Tax=Neptunicella plasticusilytica TaxID=3117012 RepID=UPI003A4DCA5A
MSQNLYQAGLTLLNAMSRHADVIMQVYLSGTLDETATTPQVVENLKKLGIIWRPEPEAELRLKSAVRNLLENSLHDERNRQIDANIGSALAGLKTLAGHYKEALHHGRFAESQAHINDLREHVYGLTESLGNSVRVLFSRINNEFGYVVSIDAKIRENELAQSQVSDMLSQIELFRFDELSETAGSNRELRLLLIVTLQQAFSRVTQELSIVQARLLELLGRFREYRGRTRLLKGFILHQEQHPDFQPPDYTQLSKVPLLFNQASKLIQPAHADVNSVVHESVLQELVGRIKALQRTPKTSDERKGGQINVTRQTEAPQIENQLKKAVEDYFCKVIDSGQRLTALDYWQQQKLDCDPEVWIYRVIDGYQSLPLEEQQYFALDTNGHPHPDYSGNFIVEDVELGLR